MPPKGYKMSEEQKKKLRGPRESIKGINNPNYKIFHKSSQQRNIARNNWNGNNPNNLIIKSDGFCIHHIDGNPENNNIDNLCKMTISEHRKLHMKGKNHPFYGKKRPNHSSKMKEIWKSKKEVICE